MPRDILPIIKRRRTIRKFRPELPAKNKLKKILEAGRWAPSGLNNQPWRFLLVLDKKQKKGLSGFTEYSSIIRSAPVVIVVLMSGADSYDLEKDTMAVGACIQNMLLEASSLGLGCCWLGEILNKRRQVCRFLNLKQDFELMAVICTGYPYKKSIRPTRKTLRNLIILPS